jgi:demethylmenaquinone methyltransferase/2-methoxy-6-polyprenyl-1,4-benzoquinol methylase
MPEAQAVNTMFAGISGRYDFANHLLSGGIDFYWRRVLVRRVKQFQPQSILDLATGSGDVLFALADRLPPTVEMTGLDFCQPMLLQAELKKQRKQRYQKLCFVQGDGLALNYPDGSFDAITLAFGLRNYEDRKRGLEEIRRILKPHGRAFILEFTQPANWFKPFYYCYLKYILPRLAGWATGRADAYHYLAGTIASFPSKDELSIECEQAGLHVINATGLSASIVALHELTKRDSSEHLS